MQVSLAQGSQTHLGVRATLQDITQSAGRIVIRDDKNAVIIAQDKTIIQLLLQYIVQNFRFSLSPTNSDR